MLVHTLENIGNFISKHKIYTSKARGMEWHMPDFNEFFSEYILGIYRYIGRYTAKKTILYLLYVLLFRIEKKPN